jgi:hypothetical protein
MPLHHGLARILSSQLKLSASLHVWWMGLWIVPLFVIALISYYAIERPFFHLRTLYRPKTSEPSR